jgi:glutaredoxin
VKPAFTGKSIEELKVDKFAQYLTSVNATMYGTEWCSHCQNQKKLFGKSFEYINFVDCDWESETCSLKGITGYPTWNINGINYPGEQSFARLAQLTNYTFS